MRFARTACAVTTALALVAASLPIRDISHLSARNSQKSIPDTHGLKNRNIEKVTDAPGAKALEAPTGSDLSIKEASPLIARSRNYSYGFSNVDQTRVKHGFVRVYKDPNYHGGLSANSDFWNDGKNISTSSKGSSSGSSHGETPKAPTTKADKAPTTNGKDAAVNVGKAPTTTGKDALVTVGKAPTTTNGKDAAVNVGKAPTTTGKDAVVTVGKAPTTTNGKDAAVNVGKTPTTNGKDTVVNVGKAPTTTNGKDAAVNVGKAPTTTNGKDAAVNVGKAPTTTNGKAPTGGKAPTDGRIIVVNEAKAGLPRSRVVILNTGRAPTMKAPTVGKTKTKPRHHSHGKRRYV